MVSKHMVGESWCRKHLADQKLFQLLEKVDIDLTEEARSGAGHFPVAVRGDFSFGRSFG
jgi:hypothetical protein